MKPALPTQRATTSASNLFRRALCPGSAAEEAKYGEPPDSEFSKEGTLLHSIFMMSSVLMEDIKITPEQRETVASANRLAQGFIREFMQAREIPEDAEYQDEFEAPLWVWDGDFKALPGHADFTRTWPEHGAAVVIDAKFGYGDQPPATENLQLCTYGVAKARQSLEIHTVGVCLVQPRNFGPRTSSAIYDRDALTAGHAEILRVLKQSQEPDQPRVPSTTACTFCRAKSQCPEFKAAFMQITATAQPIAVSTLDNEQLERMHVAIQFAAKVKEEVGDEMRRRIEAGTLPGFKLANSGDTRTVTDGIGMYQAFAAEFEGNRKFSAAAYDGTRETKWGALEELVSEVAGTTQKAAKDFVKLISAPFVSVTPKKKKIVREKGGAALE